MAIKVPCKNCSDRHTMCHSTCEKYLKFKKQNDEIREIKKRVNQISSDIIEIAKHKQR